MNPGHRRASDVYDQLPLSEDVPVDAPIYTGPSPLPPFPVDQADEE